MAVVAENQQYEKTDYKAEKLDEKTLAGGVPAECLLPM